jgi:hypothetical protein
MRGSKTAGGKKKLTIGIALLPLINFQAGAPFSFVEQDDDDTRMGGAQHRGC